MKAGREPRLLVYSQDGLGLGHLRRTSSLIRELLSARPDAGVLTVSDSPLGRFFPTAGNHDFLKLPSIRKAGPGDWHALCLPMPFAEVLRLRRELIRSVATSFEPDLLLVDHMPHGAMGELVPTLESLRGTGTRIVLGLRDILDDPRVIRQRWSVEGAYAAVVAYYDEVLVYGSRDVYDVVRQYGWPDDAARRLHYCGYVCPPDQAPPTRGNVPTRPGHRRRQRRQRILATAGGGADSYPLFDALLCALPAVSAEFACTVTIITGPFMPTELYDDLHRRARRQSVTLLRLVDDMPDQLARADLVVSMAGYNTTTEILQSGRPGLLVPRVGPSTEQRTRASAFADRSWVRCLPPERLAPDLLGDAVVAALGAGPLRAETAPDLRGRTVAAGRLLAMLQQRAAFSNGRWSGTFPVAPQPPMAPAGHGSHGRS